MTNSNNNIRLFTTEDGYPRCAFIDGHKDLSCITLGMVNGELEFQDLEQVEEIKVEHLWMRKNIEDHGEECPWEWCDEGDEGAVAVTGVKL